MPDSRKRLLFIGLGVMGFPMAGHLSRVHETIIYNRSPTKADNWSKQYAGQVCSDLSILPDDLDLVITCIGNDQDLREIYLAPGGLIDGCTEGTILVDHTTASADIAREIASAASAKGLGFIDAPVSGGEQGAINGQLTIMCGGDSGVFEKVRPVLACYAKALNLLGPAGSGQLTKMCNQIAIAGLVQGLSESIHFAEQAGLDSQQVIDVISNGAAQSWQMDNRHQTMISGEYNHGFAVDWMRKDLSICLDEARRNEAKLPVTALVDQFYADVQAMGGRRWDTSSLLQRLRSGRKNS